MSMAQRKLDSQRLLTYAVKLLGGRALSMGELREKLRRKAERPEDVEQVLGQVKEYGYLDDRKFAEGFAAARLEGGLGKARVLRDLRQRRVAPGLAGKVVEDTFRETDETALIENFLERKYRNVDLGKELQEPKRLASVYRRLRYAGFSAGNSIRILKRYAEAADELEGTEEEGLAEGG